MRTADQTCSSDESAASAAPGEASAPRLRMASLLMVVAGAFVLAAGGQWAGEPSLAAIASGAWAGLLLGALLACRPPIGLVAAYALLALAAAAVGSVIGGGPPFASGLMAGGLVAAALICHAVLGWRRIDPGGLRDARALAHSLAVAVAVLPLCQLLVFQAIARAGGGDAGDPWNLWLGTALGLVATLPAMLAVRPDVEATARGQGGRAALALFVWLPLPLMLWWRPDLLALAMLPLLAAAARLGPRWTAASGLLAGASIAALSFADSGAAGLQGAALLACVMLPTAHAIAILAGQRRRSEHAMSASHEHLRMLTERGPMLVATLDASGRHCFANRAYLQWLGKDSAEVLEHSLQQVFGNAAMVIPFQRALGGQPQRQQVGLADGRVLDAQFEPRFSPEGPVDAVHLMAQDASWRGAQARTVDALLAAAMDPSLVLDAAGLVVKLNARCQTLLGVEATDLLGQPLATWLEPASIDPVTAALARVRHEHQPQQLPQSFELHVRCAGGDAFPVELQLAPIDGSRGVQVVVAMRDLRPQLEREALMVGARTQAEITLGAIADAVVACDLQQRITVFNPAAAQISGWSEREALGTPLHEVLRFVDAESGADLPSLLGNAVARNAPVRKHPDKLLLRRDGNGVAVAESAAPMRDCFGQTSGGVVLLHDVSHRHAQAQTLTHQAQHDHLTGLPNRVLLHDRLSQALAQMDRGYKGALLYLDLDRFKPINDRLGHPVGDRVLQEVARRLRDCVREDDTVSRQGGDEFVLLLVRLADPRDAARVAGKLIEAIEQPIQVEGHELSISASIGIALFPQDGSDTGTVTKHADAALYHAKAGGRGRYSYFTDIMGASAEERMRTEHDLRIALSNGDFLLAWQPQVQLPGERVAGVEALLRWRQLDGSLMLPEDFLQVAEETGLLVQIDEWVLREACRQNRRWQVDGEPLGTTPLPVSVNVSLARFDADRLVAHVRSVLHETGLEPSCLEIEFKGAQLFSHDGAGEALVAALKALGVRVAVDDFGSGQASLGALARFAFDTLKVDRGFIEHIAEDAHSRSVISAVLGIGQAMGIRVIAKGVENQAQFAALVQLGCTGMQGRMFGDAGPAERIVERTARGAAERAATSLGAA